jgi:hypothetical protein
MGEPKRVNLNSSYPNDSNGNYLDARPDERQAVGKTPGPAKEAEVNKGSENMADDNLKEILKTLKEQEEKFRIAKEERDELRKSYNKMLKEQEEKFRIAKEERDKLKKQGEFVFEKVNQNLFGLNFVTDIGQRYYIKFNPLCENEGIKLLCLNGMHTGFKENIYSVPSGLYERLKEELTTYLQNRHDSQAEPLKYVNGENKSRDEVLAILRDYTFSN